MVMEVELDPNITKYDNEHLRKNSNIKIEEFIDFFDKRIN